MNWSVSSDRIMECISFVFSYLKNKITWYDVQLLIVCIIIFSYYLICGLLVVNSMPNMIFKDKLHRYLSQALILKICIGIMIVLMF